MSSPRNENNFTGLLKTVVPRLQSIEEFAQT